MLNQVVLMGRMVKDAELKKTANGTQVSSFAVAVDRDYKTESGATITDFIDVVAWRNTAEFVSKYFPKGSMICVCGRLQMRDYTDKDGNKRRAFEVVADGAYFCGGKNSNSGTVTTATAEIKPSDTWEDVTDEPLGDLPF